MTTEIEESLAAGAPSNVKTFNESEVEEMLKKRRERDAEALRLQHEDNKRLRSRLEELERNAQKGTASDADMMQLQTAKNAVAQGQAQGYSRDEVQNIVAWELQQKQLEDKLYDAKEKDPEFAKLIDENKNKQNKLFSEDIALTAYLPNPAAVIKQLMKDDKSLRALRMARSESEAMLVLNNLSDRLSGNEEKPAPSQYKPAEPLSDASDEDQNFDEKDYISSKY